LQKSRNSPASIATQFRSVSRIYRSKLRKKGAKLYSSEDALAAIYKTDSLEAARAEQARTAAQLNAIRADVLRKTRIPIEIVL
jgi:hypothetical protein